MKLFFYSIYYSLTNILMKIICRLTKTLALERNALKGVLVQDYYAKDPRISHIQKKVIRFKTYYRIKIAINEYFNEKLHERERKNVQTFWCVLKNFLFNLT